MTRAAVTLPCRSPAQRFTLLLSLNPHDDSREDPTTAHCTDDTAGGGRGGRGPGLWASPAGLGSLARAQDRPVTFGRTGV